MKTSSETKENVPRRGELGITKEEYERRLAEAIEEAKEGILNSKCFSHSEKASQNCLRPKRTRPVGSLSNTKPVWEIHGTSKISLVVSKTRHPCV